MHMRHIRRGDGGRQVRRVLLVGFPPLMLSALEPALSRAAEVVSVPFPGSSFDRAAEVFDPDLVVVDVTYLDETIVRPLITHRFVACKPIVVYLSDQRQAWIDDLAAVESGPLEDASVAGLARLVSGSGLRVVAER
jgi:DNA-binding response OmpR family regulator